MDAAADHWHFSLYPLPLTDDFTREEEESNTGEHGDGSGGVLEGNHEMWRSKNEEEGGCKERSWKESGEVKECKSEKEF